MINFQTPAYLRLGNLRQQHAHHVLVRHLDLFQKLSGFSPVLTGTIPIAIDLPDSDLDIICHCDDHDHFASMVRLHFRQEQDFELYCQSYQGHLSTIAHFKTSDVDVEIFGQSIPVTEQFAYRHMLAEYQILQAKGTAFRKAVLTLKSAGWKTEPAFAKLLDLDGDPYQTLLDFTGQ